VKQTKESK